jgi:hypothetical protein
MKRRLSLVLVSFSFVPMVLGIVLSVSFVARAAQIDGVQLPETFQAGGKTLYLNGFGRRTYSILAIHIYAAGLYLEHLNTDPDAIIRSRETKLLMVRFERDISAEDARKSWRTGLENNCLAPCHLDPNDVERFLAGVPAMHAADNFYLLCTPAGATVTVNGQLIGTIDRRQFAEAVLATFLGPNPASSELKQELVAGHS